MLNLLKDIVTFPFYVVIAVADVAMLAREDLAAPAKRRRIEADLKRQRERAEDEQIREQREEDRREFPSP